jgi:photosystem II stability/assembly factor-like uncharacterized protein
MKKIILSAIVALCFFERAASQGANSWKLCPLPVEADVRDIVFSAPGILVAGTSKGVYWSEDLGESWNSGNGNLSNTNIHAISDLALRRLVVSTDDGVFISSNLGMSWKKAKEPFFAKSIREFEPDYELALYAATENGVWVSQDYGDTWQMAGLQGVDLLSIAVGVNGEMLAGASRNGDDGIYHTKDFGVNWIKVVDATMGVNVLDMGPHGFFAGTYRHDPFKNNVLKSSWNGEPWKESGLINCSVSSFTYAPYPDMFAGIEERGFWPDTTTFIGVQYSPDAGNTWKAINEGLTNTNVHSLFIFWENLFAGTSTGIYKRIFQAVTKVNQNVADKFIQLNWNSVSNTYSLSTEYAIDKLNWTLIDLYGRQIAKGVENNFMSMELKLENFKNGVYFLNARTDHSNKTFQLMLVR